MKSLYSPSGLWIVGSPEGLRRRSRLNSLGQRHDLEFPVPNPFVNAHTRCVRGIGRSALGFGAGEIETPCNALPDWLGIPGMFAWFARLPRRYFFRFFFFFNL